MKNKRKWLAALLVALVFLSSCSLPGLSSDARKGIVVASGNYTERQIGSEIVAEMMRHYLPDVEVSVINNLGSATLVNQAMVRGQANICGCMYTGTSLTGELGMDPIRETDKAFDAVVTGYRERFNAKWYPSFGFANTYAFMVTRSLSEQENITKVSDLERLKDKLRVGVDTNWIQRKGDGYEAFQEIYGFAFSNMHSMEIGLVYNAVNAKEMDVVLGYSTDGRIDAYDLVVLEDDRKLFPPYDASPVATEALIKAQPRVDEVMRKLSGSIDTKTMQRLNRRSDEEHVEPAVIAKEFLQENNYFAERDPQIEIKKGGA